MKIIDVGYSGWTGSNHHHIVGLGKSCNSCEQVLLHTYLPVCSSMKMNSALGAPRPGNVFPKVENGNLIMRDIPTNDIPSHRTNVTDNRQRGRARGRIAAKEKHSSENMSPKEERSAEEGLSSADEGGPLKKRRRSRKDSDRKYECKEPECGRVYSRAEHL